MKANAYSYMRFSHPDQAKGDSLRRQAEKRDDWLRRNNVDLDTSLVLDPDKGKTGYSDHDMTDRKSLKGFLDCVESGQVERGSYLVVESLDRLTREDIIPALSLMLNLIQSGIRIVQLIPQEMVYDEKANPMQIMMMIMELSRGHSESEAKSERVGAAWKMKKRNARNIGDDVALQILTQRLPSWLHAVDVKKDNGRLISGKIEPREPHATTIKKIFRLASEGKGIGQITKRLNVDCVPVISTGKRSSRIWVRSSVAKILGNRAVVGEYQPYKGRGRKRKPDGEPIKGFYPVVIKEEQWYTAQAGKEERTRNAGREGAGQHVNIFAGLLVDVRDDSPMHMFNKGAGNGGTDGRILASYRATQGKGQFISFPLAVFEASILMKLKEIKPEDMLPQSPKLDDTGAIVGRLAAIDARVDKLKAKLVGDDDDIDPIADAIKALLAERKTLQTRLEERKKAAANPISEAWENLYLALYESQVEFGNDARMRLRALLRRVVKQIDCLFVTKGRVRIASVNVIFQGDFRRSYLIWYKPRLIAFGGEKPMEFEVLTGDSDSKFVREDGELRVPFGGDIRKWIDERGIKWCEDCLRWYVTVGGECEYPDSAAEIIVFASPSEAIKQTFDDLMAFAANVDWPALYHDAINGKLKRGHEAFTTPTGDTAEMLPLDRFDKLDHAGWLEQLAGNGKLPDFKSKLENLEVLLDAGFGIDKSKLHLVQGLYPAK